MTFIIFYYIISPRISELYVQYLEHLPKYSWPWDKVQWITTIQVIQSKHISDHNVIELEINNKKLYKKPISILKLNNTLNNAWNKEELKRKINTYYRLKATGKNQNFGTWLNAYIRDKFIPEEQTNNRPRIKIKEYIPLKKKNMINIRIEVNNIEKSMWDYSTSNAFYENKLL